MRNITVSFLTSMQVVSGYSYLRNAVRLHTILGWWLTDEDLRKHPEGSGEIPALHTSRCTGPTSRLITADLTKRLGNLHGGSDDVKRHQWFSEVTWERLAKKDIDAPYVPPVKAGGGDASQFDKYPEEPEAYGSTGQDE